jgi:hypothetical protein
MKAHLSVIRGTGIQSYLAPSLVGFMFKWIPDYYLNGSYLVFNFVALGGACLSLYYVARKLINKYAGYFIIPIAVLSVTGILSLFKYGVIFNIINMYVVFPFAVYFIIKWLQGHNWYLLPGMFLVALFSASHFTALYLSYATALSMMLATVYLVINKKAIYLKRMIPTGLGIIALNLLTIRFFIDGASALQTAAIQSIGNGFESGLGNDSVKLLAYYVNVPAIILFAVVIMSLIKQRIIISNEAKIFLCVMGSLTFILFVGLILKATSDYNRLAIDCITSFSIVMACLAGMFYKQWIITGLAIVGSIPALIVWVS